MDIIFIRRLANYSFEIKFLWFFIVIFYFIGCGSSAPVKKDELSSQIISSQQPLFDDKSEPFLIETDLFNATLLEGEKDKSAQQDKTEDLLKDKTREQSRNHPETTLVIDSENTSHSNSKTNQRFINNDFIKNKSDQTKEVVLNFENADINEVIKVIANQLGINYIMESGIKGNVTIHISTKLSKDGLMNVFHQILLSKGLAMVPDNGVWNITLIKKGISQPGLSEKSHAIRGSSMVIHVVSLFHITPDNAVKLLTPFMSPNAYISPLIKHNILILADAPENIQKISNLLKLIDRDIFDGVHLEMLRLNNAATETVAIELDEILKGCGYSSASGPKLGYQLIAIPRLNSIIFISANKKIVEMARSLITALDIVPDDDLPRTYVYNVQNGTAKDIADMLNKVFSKKNDKTNKVTKSEYNKKRLPKSPTKGNKGDAISGLRGEVSVIADETRNLIIIEALPLDYKTVRSLLIKLDIIPRQVLIEVIVAEVLLDDSFKLGIEWQYFNIKNGYFSDISSSVNLVENITSGFLYSIEKTNSIISSLRALADKNKVDILSSPHILASDGKEASIDISEEIPIVSGQVSSVEQSEVITETVEYRDTGVLLSVVPHINDNGLVTMDISQEISELSDKTIEGITSPIFFKRKAKTTLTVQNSQTIIIGGLIRERKSNSVSGIPFLKDIPIIGYLFSIKSKTRAKTEMIILITPHVINKLSDIDSVTNWFKQRVGVGKPK